MEIYNCEDQLFWVPFRTESSKIDQQNFIAINIRLFFDRFTSETVYSTLYYHSNLIRESESIGFKNIHLNKIEELPGEQDVIKDWIGSILDSNEEEVENPLMDIVKFIGEFVGENACGNNVFDLDLGVMSVHCHVLVPTDMSEEWEEVPCMVPAMEESIKTLKQVRVEEDSDQNCVICMEDFVQGSEAVLMPCSHLFHGGCIEEWLNTSHYCPICRFEMPTESVLEDSST